MRGFVSSVSVLLLVLAFSGITAELVDKFTKCGDFFFNGKAPVIPGILKDSKAQGSNYKIVCQRYKNRVRFATLYDIARKIPLFSAYKYTGVKDHNEEVKMPWMIESQLEPIGSAMREPFVKQAITGDYRDNPVQVGPGLLFPFSHTADRDTAESAFTLTNSIPEKNNLRENIWEIIEGRTRESMNTHCRDPKDNKKVSAYVLYGAVPGNAELNGRVNIPSWKWIAICCFNPTVKSWKAQAIKVENIMNANENVDFQDLKTFKDFLRRVWVNENVILFDNCV